MNILPRFAHLPILPLPSAQLFPHAVLPLHIDDPSARELLHDCLAGDRVFAIATIVPGHDPQARSPLLSICGLGEVVAHEELPDGAANVLIYGKLRVRILEELPAEHGYRVARVEPLADEYPRGFDLAPAQLTMTALADQLAARLPSGGDTLRALARAHPEPGALSDVLAAALVVNPMERQSILEVTNVAHRIEMVSDAIATAVARFDRHRVPN